MPSNDERATWALTAVVAFASQTGQIHDSALDIDDESEVITDLICDLRHLVDDLHLNWEEISQSAETHYAAEAVHEDASEEDGGSANPPAFLR